MSIPTRSRSSSRRRSRRRHRPRSARPAMRPRPTTSRSSSAASKRLKKNPAKAGFCPCLSFALLLLRPRLRRERVVVVGILGYPEPQELLVAEFLPLRVDALPVRALRRQLVVHLVRRLLRG